MAVYDDQKTRPDADSDLDPLEQAFNLPSATGRDLPGRHPDQDEDIKGLEEDFAGGEADDDDLPKSHPDRSSQAEDDDSGDAESEALDDTIGEGYKQDESPEPKKRKAIITRRRGLIAGVATLLVGGGLGALVVSSGPAQFISISKLLERFHFSALEDTGDSRSLKIYKYAKNLKAGTVENTRLGIVGQKVASRIDSSLAEIGVEKSFSNSLTGVYKGAVIDPAKFAENATSGDSFKGLSSEEFKAKFEEQFNVKLTDGVDGKFFASSEEIGGFFSNRAFNSMLAEESGYGKVSGAIATRIMGKRDGITWHPIRKLDAKIVGSLDEKFTAWVKEMKARIKNGADFQASATPSEAKNPDGTVDENKTAQNATAATDANQSIQELTTEVDNIDQAGTTVTSDAAAAEGGILKGITESTGGKIGIGITALVGILCAARAIAKAADSIKHDAVILPLIRTAMQAMSLGNQVLSGQDLDSTQMSFFAKQLNSTDGAWINAKSIQAELGVPQTGPDLPEEASVKKAQEGTLFSNVLDKIPGLDTVCSVADSFLGKFVTFAISLTTPIATAISLAFGSTSFAKDAIGSLVRWVGGSPIPTLVFGPTYGNYINYGARLAANESFAAIGGTELTPTESGEIKSAELAAHQEEIQHESFAERYFSLQSPDSLASKIVIGHSSSLTTNTASLINVIGQPFKAFGSLASIFSNRAAAAAPNNYDYGFPEVGFSMEDLNSPTYDDPYANGQAAMAILAGSQGPEYITRAQNCFGAILTTDGNLTSNLQAKIDPTSKDYKDAGCNDPGTDWKRIKFYVLDTKTAESLDCYDSSTTPSCSDVGF